MKLVLDIEALDRTRVLTAADAYLGQEPVTITAFRAPRSAGGAHDFFSEGDYWWPNPGDPDGPYIQRDGETNPDNFALHRQAMIRMSIQAAALIAAFRISGDERYARQCHGQGQYGRQPYPFSLLHRRTYSPVGRCCRHLWLPPWYGSRSLT